MAPLLYSQMGYVKMRYIHDESLFQRLLQIHRDIAEFTYSNWLASKKPDRDSIVTHSAYCIRRDRQIRKYNEKVSKYQGVLRKYPHWTKVPFIFDTFKKNTKMIADAREASVMLERRGMPS